MLAGGNKQKRRFGMAAFRTKSVLNGNSKDHTKTKLTPGFRGSTTSHNSSSSKSVMPNYISAMKNKKLLKHIRDIQSK